MAYMNPVTAIHGKAKNGCSVGGCVAQVGEEGSKHCYLAKIIVDGGGMAFGYHDDRSSAEEWLSKMVDAYLEVHSN